MKCFRIALLVTAISTFGSPRNAVGAEATDARHSPIALTLPGKWVQQPEEQAGLWQYVSADGREAVSISLYQSSSNLRDRRAKRRELDLVVETRRRAEMSVDGMALKIGEAEISREGDLTCSLHAGVGARSQMTLTRVCLSKKYLVVVFYEANKLNEDERVERGTAVLFSLAVDDDA